MQNIQTDPKNPFYYELNETGEGLDFKAEIIDGRIGTDDPDDPEIIYGSIEEREDGISHRLKLWNDEQSFEEGRYIPPLHGKPYSAKEEIARAEFIKFCECRVAHFNDLLARKLID